VKGSKACKYVGIPRPCTSAVSESAARRLQKTCSCKNNDNMGPPDVFFSLATASLSQES
jgi:hypothetical protein